MAAAMIHWNACHLLEAQHTRVELERLLLVFDHHADELDLHANPRAMKV